MRPRAKLTMRMLFAVATPMHMMAPVRAGTLSVVPVIRSIQAMPAIAAGSAVMMMKGSSQDWKLMTMSRYTSRIAPARPTIRPVYEASIVCICPRATMRVPFGSLPSYEAMTLLMSFATAPRSRPCTAPKMSMSGCAS